MDSTRSYRLDEQKEVCSGENEDGIKARNALQSIIRGACFGVENCKIDHLSEVKLTSREVGIGAKILRYFGATAWW